MKINFSDKYFKWIATGVIFLTFGNVYAQGSEEEKIFKKGRDFYNKRKYNEAIAEFCKVIKKNPNDCVAYYYRGNAYHRIGKSEDAVADYMKAIKIKSDYAGPYMGRGAVSLSMGDIEKAMEDFNKAIEINPEFPEAYFDRALGYYLKKEYDKCWVDVHHAELLGWKVRSQFIKNLRKVSGRNK